MSYQQARNRRTSKMFKSGAYTGATYSGGQNIIRHSHQVSATIQAGYTQCFNLVCYNPTLHGTPLAQDGSSAKVLGNSFTDKGSRVDNITIQMTLSQKDP